MFELYIEIALSRKPFGIEHMHVNTFLLRMADTMTFQDIDFPPWGHSVYVQNTATANGSQSINGNQGFEKDPKEWMLETQVVVIAVPLNKRLQLQRITTYFEI